MTRPQRANSVPPTAADHRRAAQPAASATRAPEHPPVDTPDGRYFVVRGRLWRRSNPALPEPTRAALVAELMRARRAVGTAVRGADQDGERRARAAVHAAKVALGERGPVWWSDGAPDYNRRLARTTPYAAWWAAHEADAPAPKRACAAPQAAGDAPPAPQS